MGLTRSELFTAEQNQLAELAKVLGHPARIAILQHLLQAEQCINGELVTELGLAQATISQHLKELKRVGLIQGTISGKAVCYCIDPVRWREARQQLLGLFNELPQAKNQDCC